MFLLEKQHDRFLVGVIFPTSYMEMWLVGVVLDGVFVEFMVTRRSQISIRHGSLLGDCVLNLMVQ